MSVQVLRLGEDHYLMWSNTVDAPVAPLMSRVQVAELLLGDGVPAEPISEMLVTTDRIGSSDPTRPLEEALADNRAGPDETWLSTEELIRMCSGPD